MTADLLGLSDAEVIRQYSRACTSMGRTPNEDPYAPIRPPTYLRWMELDAEMTRRRLRLPEEKHGR